MDTSELLHIGGAISIAPGSTANQAPTGKVKKGAASLASKLGGKVNTLATKVSSGSEVGSTWGKTDQNSSTGAGALGGAVTLMRVDHTIKAYIDGDSVTGATVIAPDVVVLADSDSEVLDVVIGVAFSRASSSLGILPGALGGSASIYWNESNIEARVEDADIDAVSGKDRIANARASAANGVLNSDVTFGLTYDGVRFPVTLLAADTTGFSTTDLETYVQGKVDTAVAAAVPGAGANDIAVDLSGSDIVLSLGNVVTDADGAGQANEQIVDARGGSDLVTDAEIQLEWDGVVIDTTVRAGAFATTTDLKDAIQAAIDDQLDDTEQGEAGDIVVSIGADDEILFSLKNSLDATGVTTTIDNALTWNDDDTFDLAGPLTVNFLYGGAQSISVPTQDDVEIADLRDTIQSLVDAEVGEGEINVVLDATNDEIGFEPGRTIEATDAEAAIAEARTDLVLSADDIDFTFNGTSVTVTLPGRGLRQRLGHAGRNPDGDRHPHQHDPGDRRRRGTCPSPSTRTASSRSRRATRSGWAAR